MSVWWCWLSHGLWLPFYYIRSWGRFLVAVVSSGCFCSGLIFPSVNPGMKNDNSEWNLLSGIPRSLWDWNTTKPCVVFHISRKNDLILLCILLFYTATKCQNKFMDKAYSLSAWIRICTWLDQSTHLSFFIKFEFPFLSKLCFYFILFIFH